MKTTLDIDDDLLIEAKAVAVRRRTTLKALVEHALQREIQPSAVPSNIASNDLIEISPYGLPRLKRQGTGTVTTEMVRQLMDEEGV
ncbi:MAG: type II toxin-antitoxin system VapB family antitoxin [Verrucomicrobiota bacterium]